jgi:TetR/AcrR family transcriptional repressor of nem operon
MAGKRFDPEVALEAALQVFWSRGYEQASAQDLVEAMGINRGSWYATFGSKAELYRLALERYCRVDLDRWREELDRPEPLVEVLRSVLHRIAAALVADRSGRGCLLANAAADVRPGTPGAAQVRAALQELHELLAQALERSRDRGELPPDADPQALAAFLLTAVQGLRVVGKANPDPTLLGAAIDSALAVLPGPARPGPPDP